MRRQIRWTERDDYGNKTIIRVTIHGQEIKWQFKTTHDPEWDYDTPPTDARWDELELRLKNRYQRGHVALERTLALVRNARQQ